ncbi:MAG: hypothetical protein E7253_07960 [Lachnospiraceae bacterium]|nr:hypothetical protein [Lachnospiraceae bacterium]
MKKILSIFCIIFVLTLTACGGKTPGTSTEDKTTNTTTEEPKIEKVVTILDEKRPVDEKGVLSYIHNEEIEAGIQQQIYNFQGNILLCSSYYDGKTGESNFILKLISTQTGELLGQKECSGMEIAMIQVLDRHVVLSDNPTGKVIIFDGELNIEKEYTLPSGSIFLNRMMTKAYIVDYEKGILAVDLSDGSEKRWAEEITGAYVSKMCGDYVTLTYTDSKTGLSSYAVMNLAGEELDILDLNKSLYAVEHNSRVWLGGMVGESEQYFYGTEEVPQSFQLESGTMATFVRNSDELLITEMKGDGSMDFYAYHPDGTFYSMMNLPGGTEGYLESIVWFENLGGYLLTNIEAPGVDKLYFWDLSVSVEGEDLKLTELKDEVLTGDAVSADLYKKAQTIGDKYGVTIKIAEQCDTDYNDYMVEQNLNAEKISRGLDIIDLSLASYPDGFIDQLYFGYFREIEINLMGNIYAVNQVEENKNGFDSFIAFVQSNEEKYVMVFDMGRGQLMEQDLYHEFAHLIDKKMQNLVDRGEKVKFSEERWASLNPDGFDYCYSYTDVPDSYYYDGYDDFFIDIYSRTFPTEDRARVMEYAMIGAEFCFDTYPGLTDKIEYYSECIRDAFDTTGWPEVTKWEEMLKYVD